tara:strand:- start:1 stop:105 length:105 start_codon:yes stop_codon:yes gene_type:complete
MNEQDQMRHEQIATYKTLSGSGSVDGSLVGYLPN